MAVDLPAGAGERFWAKVAQKDDESCWLWGGAVDKDGYGVSFTTIHNALRVGWRHL